MYYGIQQKLLVSDLSVKLNYLIIYSTWNDLTVNKRMNNDQKY